MELFFKINFGHVYDSLKISIKIIRNIRRHTNTFELRTMFAIVESRQSTADLNEITKENIRLDNKRLELEIMK